MTLSQNELMIVGKYFNTIKDYINLIKCCKRYEDILDLYKINFISINNQEEFKLFENLEIYSIYTNNDFKQTNLKTISYIEIPLSEIEQNDNTIYKNIILDYNLNVENLNLNTNFCSIGGCCCEYSQMLKNVILPYSIIRLCDNCFKDCRNLINVDLSMCVKLKEIPNGCFYNCRKLENIKLPTNITSIGFQSCYNCRRLENINLNTCVKLKKILKWCFYNCRNLKNVKLPNNIEKLNDFCFNCCRNLESINLENIIEIGDYCFDCCINLKYINLNNVIKLGEFCFASCRRLKYVTLNENVKFGESCFEDCRKLKSIGIKLKNTQIRKHCFKYCEKLKI